ncbi:MAG TPA: hypothetical protein VE133_13630 [Candidatus Sulfotelmatobacter sp.]|nr:hypothetical protein [Candidatus Sulfotelmatobacter sp.]
MTAKADLPPDRTRSRLLLAGWVLLAISVLLCLAGPHLTESQMPADIGNRMGDVEWTGIGWIICGMIVGALAVMCFVAQWVLRPKDADDSHQPGHPKSK